MGFKFIFFSPKQKADDQLEEVAYWFVASSVDVVIQHFSHLIFYAANLVLVLGLCLWIQG